jgi:SAM-dependent methyltransferase
MLGGKERPVQMSTQAILHAYNDVVAAHYDQDPQGVTNDSLDRAVDQLCPLLLGGTSALPRKVLDLGMGTGLFLSKLKAFAGPRIEPFGVDLAANMIASARRKIPDLTAEVGDAAHLDRYFPGETFDCVATHFVTGFVPMSVLAPMIWERLADHGLWSLVGGTRQAFPGLQAKANSRILRWRYGSPERIQEQIYNPADQEDAAHALRAAGFEVCAGETFEPPLEFADFDQFMEFAYTGGWLTPIIESAGLHRANAVTRWLLNRFFFPIHDHHSIVILLARKTAKNHGAGPES